MAGGLSALFRMLAESWPAAVPLPTLLDEVGPEAVAEAHRLGFTRRTPLLVDGVYPCRSFCSMRLVEDDGLVAVCEHLPPRCADLRIDPEHAFLVVIDADTVVPALRQLLGLDAAPYGGEQRRIVLGARRSGPRFTRFVLAPRPVRILDWVERFAREEPDRDVVVLTFATSSVPTDAPRRVDGVRVDWLGLDEVVVDGRIDLGSDRVVYVVNERRGLFTVAGVPLPLSRRLVPGRLLVQLLEQPGTYLSRKELQLALWPDDFDRRNPDFVKLDGKLRTAKSALSAAFREAGLDDPIEVLRTRSDTDGGYRINVDRRLVRIE